MAYLAPLGDRITVKRKEKASKVGEIYIPDVNQTEESSGIVQHVGPNCLGIISPGDEVLFGQYSGVELKVEEQSIVILRMDEVIGILREE